MHEITHHIEHCLKTHTKAAIATVVSTWNSSPRPRGSQLLVDANLHVIGSVSGGCVENDVIQRCQQAMQSNQCAFQEYGVSNEEAWEVGLTCGGMIKVHIEPISKHLLKVHHAIQKATTERQSLFTLRPHAPSPVFIIQPPLSLESDQTRALMQQHIIETEKGYLELIHPSTQVMIFGAVHTAAALAKICHILGFTTHVIDPRPVFATPERFQSAILHHAWPDVFLKSHTLDPYTAVVALHHDPKFDDIALEQAVRSECFYVGALGSIKTHQKRITRLLAKGLTEEELAKIHSPIGLPIGDNSASQIALSISAEIVSHTPKSF